MSESSTFPEPGAVATSTGGEVARHLARVAIGLGAGFVLGLIAGPVSALRDVSGRQLPWGLVLALATLVAVLRATVHLTGSRLPAAAVGIGWVGATVVLSTPTASGDLILAAGWRSQVYILGGMVLLGMAVSLPASVRGPASPDAAGTSREDQPADRGDVVETTSPDIAVTADGPVTSDGADVAAEPVDRATRPS